jgi:hypothetical protein
MHQHFMPNVIIHIVVVHSNLKINCNIKSNSLIANMMRKNMFIALPMKYCYTNVNTPLTITDCNCKLIKDNKTYDKYKDSCELIHNLLVVLIVIMDD